MENEKVDWNELTPVYNIVSQEIAKRANEVKQEQDKEENYLKERMRKLAEEKFYGENGILDGIMEDLKNGDFSFYDNYNIIIEKEFVVRELFFPNQRQGFIKIKIKKDLYEIISKDIKFFVMSLIDLFEENNFPDIDEIKIVPDYSLYKAGHIRYYARFVLMLKLPIPQGDVFE